MRTLVIGDVHNKWQMAQAILEKEKYDKAILLGDYFDDFYDTPNDVEGVAQWLKGVIYDKNKVFLLGNHDIGYYRNNDSDYTKCSGFTLDKQKRINSVLTKKDWARFKWCYWQKDILFTHAGLSLSYVRSETSRDEVKGGRKPIFNFLKQELALAKSYIQEKRYYFILQAGAARGGHQSVGGILWCDFMYEFDPVPGIRQIFGHTPLTRPKEYDSNWCIDTNLKYYALVEDGNITIKSNET